MNLAAGTPERQAESDGAPHGGWVVRMAGTTVVLAPERALVWPAGRTVFVADLHLGKAATFRARGIPVPAGTTRANLERLTGLVDRYGAHHLVVLGDFLHAHEAQGAGVLSALFGWRKRHAGLRLTVVRGNHDSHAGDPPAALGIAVVDEPHLVGPFAACHYPQVHPTHLVLAGHVHPAVHLHGPGVDRVRLPAFVLDGKGCTLPAFGEFTGGHAVPACASRQRFAVGGGRVWPLEPSAAGQAGD